MKDDDKLVGLIVRIIETEGKTTNAKISVCRKLESARKVDFVGETIDHCENTETEIKLSMHGYEWSQLEVRFEDKS